MKQSAVIICALLILGGAKSSISQQRAGGPAGGKRQGLNVNIQQLTNTLYITRIKAAVGLSDDQYNKILPFLTKYLEEHWQAAQRHNRALTQLRQANLRTAPDDEIKPLVQELDKADDDLEASIGRFQAGADPLLSPTQQGKLRIFRENIENELTNMVRISRGWAPPPPRSEPPPPPPDRPGPKPR